MTDENPMQQSIDAAEFAGTVGALAQSMLNELGPTFEKFGGMMTALALMRAGLEVLAATGHDNHYIAVYLRQTADDLESSGLEQVH